MTSPNVPFERIDHFRSRLLLGDEDTTISRASLGDIKIYLAHSSSTTSENLTMGGYLLMRADESRHEILSYNVPEVRLEDPLAPKRVLALLAFSALLEDQKNHNWTDETLLTVAIDDAEAHPDPLLRDVLGVRMRRTGHLHEGRPQEALVRTAIWSAMGNTQETLREVQSYRAPYPHRTAPLPWINEERGGVA